MWLFWSSWLHSPSQKEYLMCFNRFFYSKGLYNTVSVYNAPSWGLMWQYRLWSHCRCHISWSRNHCNSSSCRGSIIEQSKGEGVQHCALCHTGWWSPDGADFHSGYSSHSSVGQFLRVLVGFTFCLVYIWIIALFWIICISKSHSCEHVVYVLLYLGSSGNVTGVSWAHKVSVLWGVLLIFILFKNKDLGKVF